MTDDNLALVLALVRPAWMADAACREHDELSWFNPEDTREATAICRECLVTSECLDYALAVGWSGEFGIFGGLTPAARRRLRRAA